MCEFMSCDYVTGKCAATPNCSSHATDFCVNSCYQDGGGTECDFVSCDAPSGECVLNSTCHGKSGYFCSELCHSLLGGNATECDALLCHNGQCVEPHGSLNCTDREADYCTHACSELGGGEECAYVACNADTGNCTMNQSCTSRPADYLSLIHI